MDLQHREIIAGIDEAGRGPMAGPVVAAAVILNPDKKIIELNDSKLLTEKKRDALFHEIVTTAWAFGIAHATVEEIDTLNILQATFLAMRRAFAKLKMIPHRVLVDGNQNPKIECDTTLIINGDALEPAISAASILAKVTRDQMLVDLDKQYPGYGLAKHKGYCTPEHLDAIKTLGVSACHRRSFAPVRNELIV